MKKLSFLLLFVTFGYAQEEPMLMKVEEPMEEPILVEKVEDVEDVEDVPFAVVEEAPVFPGCTGSRSEKKKCLEQKMQKHIIKNFNSDLGCLKYERYFDEKEKIEKTKCVETLDSGKHQIMTMFVINEKGNVVEVKVRASHLVLKKEAMRIIKKIPKMQPGMQRGRPIRVKYILPINFILD